MLTDERLRTRPVNRNIGDKHKFLGVPLEEHLVIVVFAFGSYAIFKLLHADAQVPMPLLRWVWLSSIFLYVLTPALIVWLAAYKKRHPNYDLLYALLFRVEPRSLRAQARDRKWKPVVFWLERRRTTSDAGEAPRRLAA